MLVLKEVSKSFFAGKKQVSLFSNISINFLPNTSYVITGPSGIGKSTLLSIIASFDTPTTGGIHFEDNNIHHDFSQKELTDFRAKHIGFLFQKSYVFNEISVLENVMLPALIAGNDYESTKEYAQHLLKLLGIYDKKDMQPNLLSGGEQQRVSFARALSNKPTFLLADEPTAFLDQKTAEIIINCMQNYVKEENKGLIIVSHDLNIINFADKQLKLENEMLITK